MMLVHRLGERRMDFPTRLKQNRRPEFPKKPQYKRVNKKYVNEVQNKIDPMVALWVIGIASTA